MLRKLWLDFLYPPRCSHCLRRLEAGILCENCAARVELNRTLFCARCGARLPTGVKICHREEPCMLGGAVSYDNPVVQALVRDLKFRGLRDAARPLGDWLAAYIGLLPPRLFEESILVPLPLSAQRERIRGFNQSLLLAEIVTGKLNLPCAPELLRRERHSRPQSELRSAEDRKNNVRDCFAAAAGAVRGKKIILLDDVVTSGSTLREAALVLRAGGASSVLALAAARA